MDLRGRSTRAVMPIAGTAAVIVGGGAVAQVAHAAPAAPESADTVGAVAGLQGDFESCEAYFGFGKELVSFQVVDQNGNDGASHAVPTDTTVVFVMENEGGDTIECLPVELTEEMWDEEFGEAPDGYPDFPGAGHYIYPSVNEDEFNFIDEEFGEVTAVGFRVDGIPTGHTLVSPIGLKPLFQSQLDGDDLLFLDDIDPRVLDLLTEAEPVEDAAEVTPADAAMAAAWEAAADDCEGDGDLEDVSDPLLQAVIALEDFVGYTIGDPINCNGLGSLNLDASIILGLEDSIDYLETVTLSLPVQATTTSTTIAGTTSTVRVSPTVLARTGPDRSSSVPTALVGIGSIAAGALVLRARRRITDAR